MSVIVDARGAGAAEARAASERSATEKNIVRGEGEGGCLEGIEAEVEWSLGSTRRQSLYGQTRRRIITTLPSSSNPGVYLDPLARLLNLDRGSQSI